MSDGEYTIEGGQTDQDRLGRQAVVMAAGTAAFLTQVGVATGMACLDVGCGDGQVSIALAQLVGPAGRVVGVDKDAGALEIARDAADAAGVEVTFLQGEADTPVETATFDVALARLLLSHLVDPMAAVRAMRAAVRPGGMVAVEDLYTPSLHAEPPVPALDQLAEIYSATVRARGGDPTIGPRLSAHLVAADLTDINERTVVNPMASSHEKMFLVQLLDNMQDAIVATGAATQSHLEAIRADVAAAAERDDVIFYQARMHQVSGRRG